MTKPLRYDSSINFRLPREMHMTDKEWILMAAENDRSALLDGIKSVYNCRHADVDTDGDIYISDPQSGHWLDDEGVARIARRLEAGDI